MSLDIKAFQLMRKDGKPLSIKSKHWRGQALYLSSVCLVVHLKYEGRNDKDPIGEAEREDLRAMLRGLAQRLLEYNLWRPLVGVLECQSEQFTDLASNQEWHRGDFIFFRVESDDRDVNRTKGTMASQEGQRLLNEVNERIADLLEPGDRLSIFTKRLEEPHSNEWFRNQLLAKAEKANLMGELRRLLDGILPISGPLVLSADENRIRRDFESWSDGVIQSAKDIALNGGHE